MPNADKPVNRKKWAATVTVAVQDASGSPTPNATVEGRWSNGIVSTASTNGDGLATLYSGNLDNTVASITFTVSNIVHASLDYDPNGNGDPDGDSNGTAIVVFHDGTTAPPPSSTAAGGLSSAASVQTFGRDVADVAARQALTLSSHPTGTGRLNDEQAAEEVGVLTNVELVADSSAPTTVEPPGHALRAAEASLLDEAVDEAPLIDGELLDLLVQAL